MLTNQPLGCNTSWTISDLNENDKQHASRVIRKYINSAIYVEKEVAEMLPQRKTSCLLDQENTKDDSDYENYDQYRNKDNKKQNDGSRKSLSKYSLTNPLKPENNQKTSPESGYRTTGQSEQSEHSYMSGSTVKPSSLTNFNSELKLSLSCLNTDRTSTLDPREKQEIVQNWITKKERQQKRKALKEAREAKRKEEERLLVIEKERENFKRWLAEKKKEEERKKAQKELEEQQEKLKEAEKERQKIENEIKFNHWLRRKRKDDLEKKITEKLALIHMYEEKQKRLEMNEKAYQEWLESTRNRQKPIPMNKGLESLCSSSSVTYINPIPWKPNIDPNCKPASH